METVDTLQNVNGFVVTKKLISKKMMVSTLTIKLHLELILQWPLLNNVIKASMNLKAKQRMDTMV